MNASSNVNRIAAASIMRRAASSPRWRRKWPAAQNDGGNSVAPQKPVEDRRIAQRIAHDARLIADPRHDNRGEDRCQRAQERDRPLQRDPARAQRHQGQRDSEPTLFQREGQCQRERAERAGCKQGVRNHQARPVVAPREHLGRAAKGGRKRDRKDRKRNRTVEVRDAGIERDQ
jgi:hypothetical protein